MAGLFDDIPPETKPGLFDDIEPETKRPAAPVTHEAVTPPLAGEGEQVAPSVAAERPVPQPAAGLFDDLVPTPASEQGFFGDVRSAFGKAVNRGQSDIAGVKGVFGIGEPREAAREFVAQRGEANAYEYSTETERKVLDYGAEQTFTGKLSKLALNPDLTAVLMAEQLVPLGAATAGGVVGGLTAGPVGLAVGVGLASGVVDAASQLSEFLLEKGFDLENEDQIAGAFANPKLMAEAKAWMAKHGVAVGAIDGLTGLLGAKGLGTAVAGRVVGRAVDTATKRTALAATVNTTVESLGGGLGEGLGQAFQRGTVNLPDVYDEILLQTPSAIILGTYETALAKKGATPVGEEDIARLLRAGQPKAQVRTDTPEFQAWFAGSQTVDEQGTPQIFYHGTTADIKEFKSEKDLGAPQGNVGIYFTKDPEQASLYAALPEDEVQGVVYPAYLNLKNPYVIPEATLSEQISNESSATPASSAYITSKFMQELQAKGFDGIVNKDSNEAVVFDNSQVKFALSEVEPTVKGPLDSIHAKAADLFGRAPVLVQEKLAAAYKNFVMTSGQPRDPAGQPREGLPSFENWFAAKLALVKKTGTGGRGSVSGFFLDVLRQLPKEQKTVEALSAWANASARGEVNSQWFKEKQLESQAKNISANAKRTSNQPPVGTDAASMNVHVILDTFGKKKGPFDKNGLTEAELAPIRQGVDRFNRLYKWGLNILQLANENPHIIELQRIRELRQLAHLDSSKIMARAEVAVTGWRSLGGEQGNNAAGLLFALDQQSYLSREEKAKGVRRWPTQVEMTELVKQWGVSAEGLAVVTRVQEELRGAVVRLHELQVGEASLLSEGPKREAAVKVANAMRDRLLAAPYFPHSRFGNFALSVRTVKGAQVSFELFETEKEQKRAFIEAQKKYPEADYIVNASRVPEEVRPFIGVPPWLMDKLAAMPGVTPVQKTWLSQLRFELAPPISFGKQLIRRKNIAGYSIEGRRVFANYMFHHAKWYSKVKYDGPVTNMIKSLRATARESGEFNKRSEIADFVDHLHKEFLNPSQDWAQVRTINALWHLGFIPASAMVNLTQTVTMSAPFLGTKFGDLKSMGAFTRIVRELSTYYKRGTLVGANEWELQAIGLAVDEQVVDESQATELANVALGGNLRVSKTAIGDKARAGFLQFTHLAMGMFQMAEKWNRRVTFRAGMRLAMENPNVAWLQELKQKHALEFERLRARGWNEQQSLAYIAGKEVVQETHFLYNSAFRPRFMQGRKGAFFAFYMFTQNSLFALWHHKGLLPRYMLVMAFMAGTMGLVPDDAKETIAFIARKLFGKDFSLEREARKLIRGVLGKDSNLSTDLVLHGAGRYGFGVPALMQMVGAPWAPDVDMSRSIALQRIIPGSPTAFLQPGATWERALSSGAQQAAGAAFGIPFSMMKALSASDLDLTDFKRWESAMPRAMRGAVRSFRLASEGGERDRKGNPVLEFDMDDPLHVGELIAMAAGFSTTRGNQFWERRNAEFEIQNFWMTQKVVLMKEAYKARFGRSPDKEAFSEVMTQIRAFNKKVPDKAFVITPAGMKRSFEQRFRKEQQSGQGVNPNVAPGVRQKVGELYRQTVQ